MTDQDIDMITDSIMDNSVPSAEVITYLASDGTAYAEESHADFHSDVMTLFDQYDGRNDTQQEIRAGVFRELMRRHCITVD